MRTSEGIHWLLCICDEYLVSECHSLQLPFSDLPEVPGFGVEMQMLFLALTGKDSIALFCFSFSHI